MAEYYDRRRIKKNNYIGASQNGQLIFEMTLRDLFLAGYDFTVRSGCMIEIAWKSHYHDFITCDSPKIEMMPQDAMPAAPTTTSE